MGTYEVESFGVWGSRLGASGLSVKAIADL